MHKRRNRVAMVAAAVVSTALVLTGCSTGGGGDAASGTTTVTFWQQKFEDYQGVWFKKYVDAFNKSQDKVHVDYQVIPADTWAQKLQAAQAAGKQPDIATTNYGNIAAGVVNGQFAALDDYMPAESFSDIKENVASFVTIDGKHYAYPMLVEPSTVLYYNTDLVKAAGLDPDSPPTSWAELVDWSTKLTSGDVKGMTIASTAPDLGWSSWGLQYNACGHLPINDDWSKADATDPCFDKLLEFYKTLYQGNLIPQQPKVGYADGSPYGAGEVAMHDWWLYQLVTGAGGSVIRYRSRLTAARAAAVPAVRVGAVEGAIQPQEVGSEVEAEGVGGVPGDALGDPRLGDGEELPGQREGDGGAGLEGLVRGLDLLGHGDRHRRVVLLGRQRPGDGDADDAGIAHGHAFSDVEEHGFVVALQLEIEAVFAGAGPFGQQGLDAENKVVGDFEAQVTTAFENIKAILADAGASFDHVVKLNHYLIDLKAHQRLIGPIRAKYFIGRPQPASTTVQVGALVRPGALYEVEAVAIVPA